MRVLGINRFSHDTAACLLEDSRLVALAEEERFNRERHTKRFPDQAIGFCLNLAGIVSVRWTWSPSPTGPGWTWRGAWPTRWAGGHPSGWPCRPRHLCAAPQGRRAGLAHRRARHVTNYFHDADIHHIFPRAWCNQGRIDTQVYNSVVNKTPSVGAH